MDLVVHAGVDVGWAAEDAFTSLALCDVKGDGEAGVVPEQVIVLNVVCSLDLICEFWVTSKKSVLVESVLRSGLYLGFLILSQAISLA